MLTTDIITIIVVITLKLANQLETEAIVND